jgi:hypothetical protein
MKYNVTNIDLEHVETARETGGWLIRYQHGSGVDHEDRTTLRCCQKLGDLEAWEGADLLFLDADDMLDAFDNRNLNPVLAVLAGSSCVPPTMDLYDADEYVITSDCLSNGKTRTDT